jgi:hypothetical protein
MAAGTNDRTARTAGGLGGALVLAALGVLVASGSRLGLAALMAVLGLVAGFAVVSAGLLPARRRRRTMVERLNDGAFFAVVLSAVSLLLGITARPWTAALPGLAGGILGGLFLRSEPDGGAGPGSSAGAGPSGTGPSGPGPASR